LGGSGLPTGFSDSRSRTIMRSQNGRSSSGWGTKFVRRATTTPVPAPRLSNVDASEPERGHQNSSASLLITQSAPSSAAIRAMRVTHCPCE
jgi:hypothetical protein